MEGIRGKKLGERGVIVIENKDEVALISEEGEENMKNEVPVCTMDECSKGSQVLQTVRNIDAGSETSSKALAFSFIILNGKVYANIWTSYNYSFDNHFTIMIFRILTLLKLWFSIFYSEK